MPRVTDRWQTVSVPHTWNAADGQNGKSGLSARPGLVRASAGSAGVLAREAGLPAL